MYLIHKLGKNLCIIVSGSYLGKTLLNVAKCNLGKVNLKAMLCSWMQKACPAAPATVRSLHDAYSQSLLYAGAQRIGAAQAFRRDTLWPLHAASCSRELHSQLFRGRPKLGVAQALAGALGVLYTQSSACMSQFR